MSLINIGLQVVVALLFAVAAVDVQQQVRYSETRLRRRLLLYLYYEIVVDFAVTGLFFQSYKISCLCVL